MRKLFFGVVFWMFAVSAQASAILIMGDSISAAYGIDKDAGWVALLREKLAQKDCDLRVVNKSVSGETTAGGATRLPSVLDEVEPGLVVIELGGNDGLRGLSPKAMEKNLTQMVEQSRASGASVVLLGIEMPANYGAAYRKLFSDVFARVAEEKDVPFMPLFLEGVYDREEWMQDDGIHPNAKAQPQLLQNAWPLIKPWVNKECPLAQRPLVGVSGLAAVPGWRVFGGSGFSREEESPAKAGSYTAVPSGRKSRLGALLRQLRGTPATWRKNDRFSTTLAAGARILVR